MIDFLRGNIVHKEPDYVVIDVHGVGYRVFCANPFSFQSDSTAPVTVYIHHHVREDAILLFGFQTREEQSLFRRLLDVSGIGPKVAIGILSGGRPEAVIAAIQQENLTFLTKLPGIGKKTAQRMILDLKDKLSAMAVPHMAAAAAAGIEEADPASYGRHGAVWSEAREALMALGYSEAEVDRVKYAINDKMKETDSIDTVMKLALQTLYRG